MAIQISDQLVGKYQSARQVKVNSRGNLQVLRHMDEIEENGSSVCLSKCLSVCLNVCLSVCPLILSLISPLILPINQSINSAPFKPAARRRRRKPSSRDKRRVVRAYDLVYLDESPDYCSESQDMGTIGTKGECE